ncbi:MAG: DUF2752 domain-containing protein [Chlorobi bacterium]|nr:DUF2752 domain-containing protein [Chlorobiota bacterium]
MRYNFRWSHLEAWFWFAALVSLAIAAPTHETHFSFCIFKMMGIDFCPGCGLGHSIIFLFHGDFKESWNTHPLAILAVAVLLHRIVVILRKDIKILKLNTEKNE